jgi:hypothetical protein
MGLLHPRPSDILEGLARHGLRLLDGRTPADDTGLRRLIASLDAVVERKRQEREAWDAAREARLKAEGRHRAESWAPSASPAPDPVPAPRPLQPPKARPLRKPLWTRPTSKT